MRAYRVSKYGNKIFVIKEYLRKKPRSAGGEKWRGATKVPLLQGMESRGMNEQQQARKIGYARVSTKDQRLDMQLIALEKAGCDIIFHDHGISGKVFPRKELSKALRALCEGDTLIVHKLDRLGRDTLELLKLIKRFDERQVRLQSLTQSIDISTASGKFAFTIFSALAEHESAMNGERTKGGMAARKASGHRFGRHRKLNDEDINRARDMRKIHDLSYAEIARFFEVSPNTIRRALKVESEEFNAG